MQPTATSLAWGLPFAGLLASMAMFPIVAPRFWHRWMGSIAFAWSAVLLAQQVVVSGAVAAVATAGHALLVDYLPFIALLLALYTAGGGVLLRGGLTGTPAGNTAMLAIGMAMGTVMGTTGASMVLIHPLLRANAHRRRKVHLVLFLIVLVANASGALTPLGNPPLYLGLLHGVPFFWPARHLLAPLLVVTGALLAAFYLIDRRLAVGEPPARRPRRFRVRGLRNVALILLVVLVVLGQGFVPGWDVVMLGQTVAPAKLAGVLVLLLVTLLSIAVTPRAIRQSNDFTWHPMAEVAMLFAAIFITISPVVTMLRAGIDGPLAPLLQLSRDGNGQPWPLAYFWLTGLLSAFLDNAPTYLVFFELAGIRPAELSGADGVTLAAVSAGAVFFGGLTYIGNAPNMMLRAIAAHRGVRMPGFFGFTLLASALLLPVLAVVGLVFFS
ncbi:MAG TPA: sodium:proton antiporter [Acetobacteraceae bacterium]